MVEPRQLGVAVERKAMRRDVAATVDPWMTIPQTGQSKMCIDGFMYYHCVKVKCEGTDGADLVVSDPNAGVRRRRRFNRELAADGDDRLLQFSDVPANTLTKHRTLTHREHVLSVRTRTSSDLLEAS